MRHIFVRLVMLFFSILLLASCSDEPEPAPQVTEAQGQKNANKWNEERVWPGLAEGKCGSRVVVIAADGSSTEYHPPEQFFSQFESHDINQGESFRPATDIAGVMARYSADAMHFVSCDGIELSLDKAKLAERPGLLVLTGRGLLKLVGQQGEEYVTAIRMIKEIRFAPQTMAAAPAGAGTAAADVQTQ
jgi:hypothetical protein